MYNVEHDNTVQSHRHIFIVQIANLSSTYPVTLMFQNRKKR